MKQKNVSSTIIICDLDNVLFEADKFLTSIKNSLRDSIIQYDEHAFTELYAQYRGNITALCCAVAEQFHASLPDIKKIFFEKDVQEFIMEGAADLVRSMQSDSRLIIATTGDKQFQKSKIDRLQQVFPELIDSEIIISQDKKKEIIEVIQNCSGEKKDRVIIIDDRTDVLEDIWESFPEHMKHSVRFIRMKYGKYQYHPLPDCLKPMTTEVTSLHLAKEAIHTILFQKNEPRTEITHPGMVK